MPKASSRAVAARIGTGGLGVQALASTRDLGQQHLWAQPRPHGQAVPRTPSAGQQRTVGPRGLCHQRRARVDLRQQVPVGRSPAAVPAGLAVCFARPPEGYPGTRGAHWSPKRCQAAQARLRVGESAAKRSRKAAGAAAPRFGTAPAKLAFRVRTVGRPRRHERHYAIFYRRPWAWARAGPTHGQFSVVSVSCPTAEINGISTRRRQREGERLSSLKPHRSYDQSTPARAPRSAQIGGAGIGPPLGRLR